MTTAAVFPGQGSQFVGMGFDLADRYAEVPEILDLVDETLDFPLSELIRQGPKEILDETINAQPAIFTINYIYWRLLKKQGFSPEYLAGHSLGELSACLAAGVFSFEAGLSIVRFRAELMSEAAARVDGGMMAVLGLEDSRVVELAGATGLEVANYNCPGQVVVAGRKADLEQSGEIFKDAGAKKVVPLAVSGPFHSSAMSSASGMFAEFLSEQRFEQPSLPIFGNAGASVLLTADQIKQALAEQLARPVRWRECVIKMIDRGVDGFVEAGPGRVLSALIKRISTQVEVEHAADRLAM